VNPLKTSQELRKKTRKSKREKSGEGCASLIGLETSYTEERDWDDVKSSFIRKRPE